MSGRLSEKIVPVVLNPWRKLVEGDANHLAILAEGDNFWLGSRRLVIAIVAGRVADRWTWELLVDCGTSENTVRRPALISISFNEFSADTISSPRLARYMMEKKMMTTTALFGGRWNVGCLFRGSFKTICWNRKQVIVVGIYSIEHPRN